MKTNVLQLFGKCKTCFKNVGDEVLRRVEVCHVELWRDPHKKGPFWPWIMDLLPWRGIWPVALLEWGGGGGGRENAPKRNHPFLISTGEKAHENRRQHHVKSIVSQNEYFLDGHKYWISTFCMRANGFHNIWLPFLGWKLKIKFLLAPMKPLDNSEYFSNYWGVPSSGTCSSLQMPVIL